MAKIYVLRKSQQLPISLEKAWEFISSPRNLKVITPDYMGFDMVDHVEDKMYPGQIIRYMVKPVLNIPMNWVTEITHVREPDYFVDEQRFGPYSFWHHKHFLRSVKGGVEMTDIVHYAIPFGILGRLANSMLVSRQLEEIFNYRFQKLNKLFPSEKLASERHV